MLNTTLRLSAPAVKVLLERDPAFEFELQRCVIAEIVRGMMPKNLDAVYRKTISDEIGKVRNNLLYDLGREGKTYDKLVEQQINDAVTSIRLSYHTNPVAGAKKDKIADAIGKAIDVTVGHEIAAKIASIQETIGPRIDLMVEAKKLDAKIEQAIDAQVEAEIERRVAERLLRIAEAARTAGGAA